MAHRQQAGKGATLKSRKAFLEALQSNGGWVNIQVPKVETYVSRLNIVNNFLKMGAIETKPGRDEQVLARITMYGRELLVGNYLTYTKANMSLGMPRNLYNEACKLAKELGMIHRAGTHVGERGSVIALVRAIVNRHDAFKRWYKSNYAEELEEAG